MSEKIRETEVVREPDGRVAGYVERPQKKGGGFGWGLLFAVIIIGGGILAFAYSQGSFESAGARTDQATQSAQTEINQGVENAGDAAQRAGNNIEDATDTATN